MYRPKINRSFVTENKSHILCKVIKLYLRFKLKPINISSPV